MLEFVNVPLMIETPLAEDPPARLPVVDGAAHVNVVPAGKIPLVRSVGVTVNITPLHVTVLIGVISVVGLTVTVSVNDEPFPQSVEVGVTI